MYVHTPFKNLFVYIYIYVCMYKFYFTKEHVVHLTNTLWHYNNRVHVYLFGNEREIRLLWYDTTRVDAVVHAARPFFPSWPKRVR